jgi:hypothetical protein
MQNRQTISPELFTCTRIFGRACRSEESAIRFRRLLRTNAGLSQDKSTQSHYHAGDGGDFSFCEACEEKELLSPARRTLADS